MRTGRVFSARAGVALGLALALAGGGLWMRSVGGVGGGTTAAVGKGPATDAGPATAVRGARPALNEERVRAALRRFNEVANRMTRADLRAEQERLRAAKERFAAVVVQEPVRESHVDARGHRWIKLSYPSGAVRYEFPAPEETGHGG
jgi:hypothetical protein